MPTRRLGSGVSPNASVSPCAIRRTAEPGGRQHQDRVAHRDRPMRREVDVVAAVALGAGNSRVDAHDDRAGVRGQRRAHAVDQRALDLDVVAGEEHAGVLVVGGGEARHREVGVPGACGRCRRRRAAAGPGAGCAARALRAAGRRARVRAGAAGARSACRGGTRRPRTGRPRPRSAHARRGRPRWRAPRRRRAPARPRGRSRAAAAARRGPRAGAARRGPASGSRRRGRARGAACRRERVGIALGACVALGAGSFTASVPVASVPTNWDLCPSAGS